MPQEKSPVIADENFVEAISRPCDLCGETAPLSEKINFLPYEITVRHNSERTFSERKICLCEDCFDSLRMEWDRLKKGE